MSVNSSWSRFRPLLLLGGLYLALAVLLRLILWQQFGAEAGVGWPQLPGILLVGAVNDLVALVFLGLPVTLLLALFPQRLTRWRWLRIPAAVVLTGSVFGMLYLVEAEFFFVEFNARFNLVAVDYLIYPHEVLVNIWQSYPVVRIVLADLLAAALLVRWTRPWWRPCWCAGPGRGGGRPLPPACRCAGGCSAAVGICCCWRRP